MENVMLWLLLALGIWFAPAIIVGTVLAVALCRRPAVPPPAHAQIGDRTVPVGRPVNDLLAGRSAVAGAAPKGP
jgi:hypothetical protein